MAGERQQAGPVKSTNMQEQRSKYRRLGKFKLSIIRLSSPLLLGLIMLTLAQLTMTVEGAFAGPATLTSPRRHLKSKLPWPTLRMVEEDEEDEIIKDDSSSSSLDDFLDKPFFDPDNVQSRNPLVQWFADLVKNDYEAAEALYVGALMVVMVVVTQEVLRMQMYGENYVPFMRGGGRGGFF